MKLEGPGLRSWQDRSSGWSGPVHQSYVVLRTGHLITIQKSNSFHVAQASYPQAGHVIEKQSSGLSSPVLITFNLLSRQAI